MSEQRIAEGLPDWIKDHLTRYLESGGTDGHMYEIPDVGTFPCLLLTTTGRKSGLPLTLPLIYGKTDGAYCIIASKGGAPAHPAWYLNLEADPAVHLQVATEKFNATARLAQGEERQQLWDMMVGVYPPYTDYQAATDREIPVVVLEPA